MVRQLVCALAAVTVLVGWAVSSPLRADGAAHGLALFADLKYGADFTHFDYVNPDAPKGGDVRYATVGSFDNLNRSFLKVLPPLVPACRSIRCSRRHLTSQIALMD